MRALRRPDHAPRLEMMPLIDVIFLLLTFFIYQMVVMRPVDTLGVELAPVAGGGRAVGDHRWVVRRTLTLGCRPRW